MKNLQIIIFLLCFSVQGLLAQPWPLIPQPSEMKLGQGVFVLTPETRMILKAVSPEAKKTCDWFLALVNRSSGLGITYATTGKAAIIVEIDSKITHPEGYRLNITPQSITVSAQTPTGLFYAFQTIRQLLPPEIESMTPVAHQIWKIPVVEINDAPRFPYRGMMLDVARHFFPINYLKRQIDLMAMYKYNHLHLHLTDDQGWRIEILSYPALQNNSAWRRETMVGHLDDSPRRYDGRRYGGYYKQSELRELVQYAADRFITIVPEIDMPGHATAVLAAYPELSCSGNPVEVSREWGVHKNLYCPKEETFVFLERVLSEVMSVFPGPYIHIGGDECVKDQWQQSEYCHNLKRQNGLQNDDQLQSYFIRRIANYVNAHGRSIIGWDEILDGGDISKATIMSWRNENGGLTAARRGYNAIMTPHRYCYFDYYQWRNRNEEPLAIGGYLPLSMVYTYNPVPKDLPKTLEKHILGAQANLWTEYIKDEQQLEYMLYPRVCALSETNWTPQESKSYDHFLSRLREHSKRFEILNINFARHFMGGQN